MLISKKTLRNYFGRGRELRGELSSFAGQLRYAWELDSWAQSYVDSLVVHMLYILVFLLRHTDRKINLNYLLKTIVVSNHLLIIQSISFPNSNVLKIIFVLSAPVPNRHQTSKIVDIVISLTEFKIIHP